MPRMRMVHQEFFTSPSLTQVPATARLLFIAMLIHADDIGHCRSEPAYWKAVAFPCDARISVAKVTADVGKLQQVGCIEPYIKDGITFFRIPAWNRWQKVKEPSQWRVDDTIPAQQVRTTGEGVDQPLSSPGEAPPSLSLTLTQSQTLTRKNPPRASRKKRATASDSQHQEIVDHIHDTLKAKLGQKPMLPYPQMGRWIRNVLKDRTPEHVMAVWDHWLSSEDQWAKEHAWAWNQFQPSFNAVELALKEGRPYGRTERTAHKRARLATLPDPPEAFGAGGPFKL